MLMQIMRPVMTIVDIGFTTDERRDFYQAFEGMLLVLDRANLAADKLEKPDRSRIGIAQIPGSGYWEGWIMWDAQKAALSLKLVHLASVDRADKGSIEATHKLLFEER